MKFTDIEKFPQCRYSIEIGLKYLREQLIEWEAEDDLDINPDFQRGRVWDIEQKEKYMEYLLSEPTTDAGRNIYFNHPGWDNGSGGQMVCVDGLQRITAITDFFDNKFKVFGYYYKEFEDKLPHSIKITIGVNNFQTRKEVLKWYLQINDGGTPHSQQEIQRVKELLDKEENKNKKKKNMPEI